MAGPSISQLSPAVAGVVQWTLVGIEVLLLAWIVAWLGRNTRLGRLARQLRPFRRRASLSGARSVAEVGSERPARLVSIGGGGVQPVHGHAADGSRPAPGARGARGGTRTARTPARGAAAIGREQPDVDPRGLGSPLATLHCPGCGTEVARGDLAPRLVMRCPGCDRRVAMRRDGGRMLVTLDG